MTELLEESNRIKTFELPYVAGIIDGEGCINFIDSGHDGLCLCLQIRVNMTNLAIPLGLHKQFGGTFKEIKVRNVRHRTQYGWSIFGEPAVLFLEQIFPWLVVKRKQAILAIGFGNAKFWFGQPEAINGFRAKMHELNKRGA